MDDFDDLKWGGLTIYGIGFVTFAFIVGTIAGVSMAIAWVL